MKMLKTKVVAVLMMLVLCTAFGCTSKNGNESEPEANTITAAADNGSSFKEDTTKYRVGGQVSDAYVDPSTIKEVPEDQVKAKGYEYDYDSLTYELVWSDEFDVDGLPDSTKWGYDTGAGGWGNNELQYYTNDSNAEVKDGLLVITARKEEKNKAQYTSARMVTKNKGDWLYGKFEICAKLPSGRGTWPAIWMLPTDWKYGGWPSSGEIDIMEYVGYDQDSVHFTVHTKAYNHSINTQKGKAVKRQNVTDDFHVYGLEWLPDKMIWTMDGEVVFSFEPTKFKSSPTSAEWPFDKRMHLLLNFAVGGDWGGARGVDEDIWPRTFEIDYVRVYQSPEINAIVK